MEGLPARVTTQGLGQATSPKSDATSGRALKSGRKGRWRVSVRQFLCQHQSPLLRFRKPGLVRLQSRHGTSTSSCWNSQSRITEPFNGGRSSFFGIQERRHGRLFPHDSWHPEARLQTCQQTKGSVSGKARSEGLLGIGQHGETRGRVSAVPVPFEQVPRGLGECTCPSLWCRVMWAAHRPLQFCLVLRLTFCRCRPLVRLWFLLCLLPTLCCKMLLDTWSICGLA